MFNKSFPPIYMLRCYHVYNSPQSSRCHLPFFFFLNLSFHGGFFFSFQFSWFNFHRTGCLCVHFFFDPIFSNFSSLQHHHHHLQKMAVSPKKKKNRKTSRIEDSQKRAGMGATAKAVGRYKHQDRGTSLKRLGRPRKIFPRDKRHILRLIHLNPFISNMAPLATSFQSFRICQRTRLEDAAKECWMELRKDGLEAETGSMLQAVIAAKGWYTKYYKKNWCVCVCVCSHSDYSAVLPLLGCSLLVSFYKAFCMCWLVGLLLSVM